MTDEPKICHICKLEHSYKPEKDPVLHFYSNNLMELYPSEQGSHHYHAGCVIKQLQELLKSKDTEIYDLSSNLKRRKAADKIVDQILNEVDQKGTVSLTENIILYSNRSEYFLKVTDYQKGYWAQVPLKIEKLRAVLQFFEQLVVKLELKNFTG